MFAILPTLSLEKQELLAQVVEVLGKGIIVIDHKGQILVYNKAARTIFGLDPRTGPGHPAGHLLAGDLVVIANNSLGSDDGNFQPQHLKALGIQNPKLKKGDPFLALGEFGNLQGQGLLKTVSTRNSLYRLSSTWKGKSIQALIDTQKKNLEIQVDDQNYSYPYRVAAGHMVILDGDSGETKFYQSRGYTARQESIGQIFKRRKFSAKGPLAKAPSLQGTHINEIHPDSPPIQLLLTSLEEETELNSFMEYVINGVPVRCYTHTLHKNHSILGGLLLIEDVSEVKLLAHEMDEAVDTIHKMESQMYRDHEHHIEFPHTIGQNHKVREMLIMARRASQLHTPLFLSGEYGTGKTLLARSIHDNRPGNNIPHFYSFHCTKDNHEKLFQHIEKQKITGGTLYIQCIDALPLPMQKTVLDTIKEHEEREEKNCRIIASTENHLEQAIEKGMFLLDLYQAISLITIFVPPLRHRKDDLPLLAQHFLSLEAKTKGRNPIFLGDTTLQLLQEYDWPGNIQELKEVLLQCAEQCQSNILYSSDLPPQFQKPNISQSVRNVPPDTSLDKAMDEAEKSIILQTLLQTKWNRTKAAKQLNISRTTLYNKLWRYQLLSPQEKD